MKKYIILSIILFSLGRLQAQQDPHFTQFMFNKLALNPAYAGSHEAPCLSILHRSQWQGIEGAPTSQTLGYHQTAFDNRVGLGLNITHDNIGPTDSWRASMAYAYRLKIDEGRLSIGLQGSLYRYMVNWTDAQVSHLNDNLVAGADQSNIFGNVGAGIYFEQDGFYMGASIPHIIRTDISLLNNTSSTDVNSFEENHVYLMAGTLIPISENLQLKPAILLKYVRNAPIDFDFNLSLVFVERFILGLSYRYGGSTRQGFGESIDVVATVLVNQQLRLGGAFDFTLSELNNYSIGSFEIFAQYCWQQKDVKGYQYKPRFF